ncbi:MAG: hypothetical protein U0176_09320 [Bacteroidia bacterium]
MQNKKRSLRLVLLLALSGFASLIYYTSQHNRLRESCSGEVITYALNVEMKWVAMDANADFTVVQETLSHYAGIFAANGMALQSEYKLDHCCEDAALQASVTGGADFYHLSLSAEFSHPRERELALVALEREGFLRHLTQREQMGLTTGSLSLSVPVPGRPGQVLDITDGAYELSLAPRVAYVQEADPMS